MFSKIYVQGRRKPFKTGGGGGGAHERAPEARTASRVVRGILLRRILKVSLSENAFPAF